MIDFARKPASTAGRPAQPGLRANPVAFRYSAGGAEIRCLKQCGYAANPLMKAKKQNILLSQRLVNWRAQKKSSCPCSALITTRWRTKVGASSLKYEMKDSPLIYAASTPELRLENSMEIAPKWTWKAVNKSIRFIQLRKESLRRYSLNSTFWRNYRDSRRRWIRTGKSGSSLIALWWYFISLLSQGKWWKC